MEQQELLIEILGDERAVQSFLRSVGMGPEITVEELTGGVSSRILRVTDGRHCTVLKQALPRLKVGQVWESRPERSRVEAQAAETIDRLLPGAVPRVLAVMPDAHAFAMACAPEGAEPWKAQLLLGIVDNDIARAVGTLLGALHAASASDGGIAARFSDRSFFKELRLDPYFRSVAIAHPSLSVPIARVIDGLDQDGLCLVHGDFSPKNLLVTQERHVLLVDHEVAHWGHPAFDVAFVVSHLCLKAVHLPAASGAFADAARSVIRAYRDHAGGDLSMIASGRFSAEVLGALLLARVDGKSPVEYLTDDAQRDKVRASAAQLLATPPVSLEAAVDLAIGTHVHA